MDDTEELYADLAMDYGSDNVFKNDDGSVTVKDKVTVSLVQDENHPGEHYCIKDDNGDTEYRIGIIEMFDYVNELLEENLVTKFFKNEDLLEESIYASRTGFEWQPNADDSKNIFGLIRQIKSYTADMNRDEAIEKAVYVTADFVKEGNL
jgi:hypothetical protein